MEWNCSRVLNVVLILVILFLLLKADFSSKDPFELLPQGETEQPQQKQLCPVAKDLPKVSNVASEKVAQQPASSSPQKQTKEDLVGQISGTPTGRQVWVAPQPKGGCPKRNFPEVNLTFWENSYPGYKTFSRLHHRMVKLAVKATKTMDSGKSEDELSTVLMELLTLSYDLVLSVRDNPHGVRATDERDPIDEALNLPKESVDESRYNAIKALEERIANIPDQSLRLFSSVYRFRDSMLRKGSLRKNLKEGLKSNGRGYFKFSERVFNQCKKRSRAIIDPDFKPTDFFDLGARDYSKVVGRATKHEESSIRFFETHYPRFNDEMAVHIYEANEDFAKAYEANFLPGHPKAKMFIQAVWVHDKGIGIQKSNMLSIKDSPQGDQGENSICLPSGDVLDILGKTQGLAAVKLDIEWSEWNVFERLARNPETLMKIGELFLECHSWGYNTGKIFPLPEERVQPNTLGETLLKIIDLQGPECYMLHDFVRYHGVSTNMWV